MNPKKLQDIFASLVVLIFAPASFAFALDSFVTSIYARQATIYLFGGVFHWPLDRVDLWLFGIGYAIGFLIFACMLFNESKPQTKRFVSVALASVVSVALLAWLFHIVFFQSRAPRVRSVDYHFDLQTITAAEFFDEGDHRVEIGCRYFVSPDRKEDAKPGRFSETPVESGSATILLRSRDEFGKFRRPFETTVEAAESIARKMEAGTMFDVPIPATVVFGSNDVHQVNFAAVVFASANREPPHKIIHAFTIAAPFEPTGDLAGHMATVYMHFCIPGTDQLSNPRVLLDFLNEVTFED